MTTGDLTLTNYGAVSVSGSALKTLVDSLNITSVEFISGSRLHLIPIENGQVNVVVHKVEG